jgi:ABC-type Na+ efflux pump permease subunit
MRRLLFFVLIAVSVIPSHGQKQQTGKAYGSVGYITSKKAFMQDASGVTLIFTDRAGKRTTVQTSEIGDYVSELPEGQYCVTVFSPDGRRLSLAANQLKCIRIVAHADKRLDIMLKSTSSE